MGNNNYLYELIIIGGLPTFTLVRLAYYMDKKMIMLNPKFNLKPAKIDKYAFQ